MTDMSKRPASTAVAEAIREARIKKGMSKSELAVRSGLSRSVVSEIENKVRPAKIVELQRLERGLDEDGVKLFAKAFLRRAKRDPTLRAMTLEVLDVVIADLEKALQDGDDEASDSGSAV